jgi:hypothetical protein
LSESSAGPAARIAGPGRRRGVGLIGCGMRFIFLLNDQRPVTTSRVLRVHVDRSAVAQPASSPSIH